MLFLSALLAASITSSTLLAQEEMRVFSFSKEDLGKVPAGWRVAKTGSGDGSVWQVVADDTVPSKKGLALAQMAAGPKPLFNLCIVQDVRYLDPTLSVALRPVQGKIDQGGGLVWRYLDANNYYICRYNPLEDNFRVYKVVDGKRILLQSKDELKLRPEGWHTIQVKQTGKRIECFLNGTKYLDTMDDTFSLAGQVGLWTKADAQTHFDVLMVQGK